MYVNHVEHRVIVRNLEDDRVVHVDHVGHCPGVRNLEDDDVGHMDHGEFRALKTSKTNSQGT